jgi:tetratricopeptide (TPR) repeat protein
MVPRPVNSLFTGRTELVDRIQSALRDDDQGTTKVKRLVITGIGGIGKSEVCLQVAHMMRKECVAESCYCNMSARLLIVNSFWGVFWVDVGSESNAKNDFLAVAKTLGSSAESVEESLRVLANTKEHWLLILDNADDPRYDYARYLPSGTHGAVLMTSRIPQCARYSMSPVETLEGLDEELSTQLFLKAALVPEESWQSWITQAQEIVRLLGAHTLALIQAGAYIAEGYCRLDQYLERYQRQRKRLLEHYPEQEQSRYRHVYATFEASIDVLGSSGNEAGRDALDLLAILSTLQSSVLPLHVFAEAWADAKERLKAEGTVMGDMYALSQRYASQLPEFIDGQANEWDDYRLNKASTLLTSLSLVTRHRLDDLDGLSMHPLTHAWAKDRLGKEQQQAVWVRVGCLLALSRRKGWSEAWQVHEKLLRPHLQAFLSPSVDAMFSFGPLEMMAPILLHCGWALNQMREDGRLESLLDGIYRVLQITPSNPSQEHVGLWRLAASNMSHMGHGLSTVALLEHVVKVRETTVAETHPDRLLLQHELASAYRDNGQITKAVALLEQVVKVEETTLAETHPDRLLSQHALASAYRMDGQITKAVALLEHVVKVQETTLTETYPDRLLSQHELASAYRVNGQITEAVALLEHVVKVRKTTLTETHPNQLSSQHELASAYLDNGQTTKAVALLEHVVNVRETTLTETHPDRLSSQHELASAYLDNGQITKAVALLEHVVKVWGTTLAETHANRLTSQHELGRAYYDSGQTKEAVTLLEHVVAVRSQVLEENRPERLASQHMLAVGYYHNGQTKEAIALLEHVVAIESKVLEENHPDRLLSIELLQKYRSRLAQSEDLEQR